MSSFKLADFAAWLETTRASHVVQSVAWIIPAVQSIHIVGIAAALASMVMLDLRVLGVGSLNQTVESVAGRLMPWVWSALLVLLLTGIVMIIGEPGRSLVNPIFQLKMVLLATAIGLTLGLRAGLRRQQISGDVKVGPLTKATAVISIVVWVAIVFAGRWIAYGDMLFDYGGN